MDPWGESKGSGVNAVRNSLVAQGVWGERTLLATPSKTDSPKECRDRRRRTGAARPRAVDLWTLRSAVRALLAARCIGSSWRRVGTYELGRRSAGEHLGVRNWAALQGDAVVPQTGEEVLQLVGVHDPASPAGGVAAGVGHGHHLGARGGQKAPVVAVD